MALMTKDFTATGKSSDGSITYTYILRVTQNSVNEANNTSNISVEAIIKQDYAGTGFSNWTTNATCTINGNQLFSDSAKQTLSGTAEKVLYTWNCDIAHNSDGTLSITVGGHLWQNGPANYSPPMLTITENSSNAMVLVPTSTSKPIYIHDGTSYAKYVAYIHDGTSFERYRPYIHNGSSWVPYNG